MIDNMYNCNINVRMCVYISFLKIIYKANKIYFFNETKRMKLKLCYDYSVIYRE